MALGQNGLRVVYSQPLTADNEADTWQRLQAKFHELCIQTRKRGVVARQEEADRGTGLPLTVEKALTAEGIELSTLTPASPDPYPGAGWTVLVLPAPPALVLQVLEDRRVSAVIYVPRNAAELRHFTSAYPDSVAV